MAGSDPPRRRGNRLRRSSSSESLVSIRSRSPSPADKKRQNHHLPYWMLAVAIAIALPQRDLLHLPPSIIGTHDYDINTKSDMFFSPDYSDEHFFDAFKTTQPAGIRWRDDFFKRTPRDAVTVMPILAETRPLIEHHRNHPTHLPPGSSRLSEEPSLEDIELIDVLWRSDLVSDADGSVLEKGTVIARQEEHDLHTLTEKSRIAPLSRDDATRYEELSKGYYEDFYSSVGPHAQAAGCSSETSEKLYVDPSSVASCSSPISPASSASHSSASHSTPSPTVQHKSDLPTDEELEALFDEMLYKDGPLEHLGMSSASVLPNHMHRQQLLHNVSLGIPYAAGNLTDVIPSVQFTPACEPSLPQVPVAAFNSTPFWHHNHTEGPLPGYLRTDGITNLTMAMQHPAANLTEIGALQQNSAAYPQNNISNLAVPCAAVGLGGIYDSHYYGRRSISISNESSIESSTSSSSSTSPRYSSEAENHSPLQSRFYGKLLPTPVDEHEKFLYSPDQKNILHSPASFAAVSASAPRRRGRQSKDEQLAAAYRLPASAAHIADMSLPELQKMLRCENLTDEQKTLIRKIRRRGKNKVAARTCRMRRGEMRGPQSQAEHDQHIEMHEWEEPARTLYRRQ